MFSTKNLTVLIGKQASIALAVLVCSIIAVFFLSQQIDKVSKAAVQNRQLADKLSKRTELFSVLAHDVAILGTNDAILERAFPPADNILEFILVLENTAFKNGVTQSFHFGNPVGAPDAAPFPLSTIDYQNTLTQNITSFSKYLKDFESLPYFTRIDGISFTSQDATLGWNGTGTASYRAVLYTKTAN